MDHNKYLVSDFEVELDRKSTKWGGITKGEKRNRDSGVEEACQVLQMIFSLDNEKYFEIISRMPRSMNRQHS